MISKILVKKISKSNFRQKDTFTIIDVAPKEYYKLSRLDKLYFSRKIMGFERVLENIKPHDVVKKQSLDGTVYECMVGNEFVYSLANLIRIWEKTVWISNSKNGNAKFEEILMKIMKKAQKENGNSCRVIFVMEKD